MPARKEGIGVDSARAAGVDRRGGALLAVADEASRLHFRLAALVEHLHGQGPYSSGLRAVLRNLIELGPRTVPQLAAMRPVSRQYIQMLVNELAAEGLVRPIDNPMHKRSKLIAATDKGRGAFRAMLERERPAVARLTRAFAASELDAAARTLRRLRQAAEAETADRAGCTPAAKPGRSG